MAPRFLPWIKLTFVFVLTGGLIGLTVRTNLNSELPASRCGYNATLVYKCRSDVKLSSLQCVCMSRGCKSKRRVDFDRSSSTTVCDCVAGDVTVEALCNETEISSTCAISSSEGRSQKACNASLLSSGTTDAAMQRCLQLPCEPWSEWTNCTATCDGGVRQRSRQCPSFDQDQCSLKQTADAAVCNTAPCPKWSVWSGWSSCTATCNSGLPGHRTRTRACPNPNACGGGPAFQTQSCTSNITCPTWSDWEQWGACSRTCNRGDRSRRRHCNSTASDDTCLGSDVQMEPCSDLPCPFRAHWSAWSPCTATCGGGVKTRSKLSCVQGPPACPLVNEQDKCNEQACPQWSNWEPWMECSRTCGGGQRVRKRTCPIDYGCVGRTMHLDKLRCNDFECPTRTASSTVSSLRLPVL